MADISQLSSLQSSEPIDLDLYPEAKPKSTFRLPAEGRYTVQSPSSFDATAFGASAADALTAAINPTIVGPSNEGFTLRSKVSAKTFGKGVKESWLGRYLKACGVTGTIPGEPQAQADAVEATAGKMYQVDLMWKAENRSTGLVVKGMKNFPLNEDGTYQQYVEDPNETVDINGKQLPKRVYARLEIVRFHPLTA